MKNRIFAAALMAVSMLCVPMTASAEVYDTYTYDSRGEAIPSQAGYVPERAVSGYDIGADALKSPSDIFIASDGIFYIADTDNDRIIAADSDLTKTLHIYESFTMPDGSRTSLSKPKGVYVSPEKGMLCIADSENERVLVSDMSGRVTAELTRPDSQMYNAPTFKPQKVLADKAGNIYTVVSSTMGAAMYSPDGDFIGFYGANRVEPTAEVIAEHIKGLFMSDEKRLKRVRNIPSGITNFDISGDFIYTCTASQTQQTDTVKKLNAAGKNIFSDLEAKFGDYKPMYDTSHNQLLATSMTDIDIGEDGCINCLDLTEGRIFRYDEDCELMFIVGARDDRLGGFSSASAIESCGGRLYVADSSKNTITVFRETEFGAAVNLASALYSEGRYEEALEPWYDVLSRDGNYRRANIGVASALLRQGDYKGAMKYAKRADSPELYDKAFEGRRREFLQQNFGKLSLAVLLAAAASFILKRKKRRRGGAPE